MKKYESEAYCLLCFLCRGLAKKKKKRGRGRNEEPFREAFGRLGDLRALLPDCPIVALTASLRVANKKLLQKVLNINDTFVVNVSPNKDNIKMLSVNVKGMEEALSKLDWIVESVKARGTQSRKTIIFCNVMTDIAHVLSYLLLKLGESAYVTENNQKVWLIGVYHSKSWPTCKEHIESEFSVSGGCSVRVILATTALGMGVNYPDVTNIVHFLSPSRTLEGNIQQLGRAGRNGKQAYDITIYANRNLSECESDIRDIFKKKQCLRKGLLHHFDEAVTCLIPKHFCCSVCASECDCSANCPEVTPMSVNSEPTEAAETINTKTRSVTQLDKDEMRAALIAEQEKLSCLEGGLSLFGMESSHGFSDSLIKEIVKIYILCLH